MSNLVVIILAKTLLLAGFAAWLSPGRAWLVHALALAYGIGTLFGLAFFVLFYIFVPAIGYHDELTIAFVAVNATLSYGATAATIALLPLRLAQREPAASLMRERAYYSVTLVVCAGLFVLSGSAFLRAFSIGAALMSLAEIAALGCGLSGPVSRMLHRDLKPLGAILAASAGLGVFYESLNLAFPVWQWVTLADLPGGFRTAVMMMIGYIVLIHPLFVVTRLVIAPPRQPDS